MEVTPNSQIYAVNPTSEPNTTRYPHERYAGIEIRLRSKPWNCPATAAVSSRSTPPPIISMLVVRNGESGSAAVFEMTEPQAHEAEASTRITAPTGSTRAPGVSREDTNSTRPAKPSSSPATTVFVGRDPPRAHSSPTIQIGATAMSTAASPDGTRCSAHATLAFPPRSRNAPITVAERHCC